MPEGRAKDDKETFEILDALASGPVPRAALARAAASRALVLAAIGAAGVPEGEGAREA
jgi:hypothetical protein